MTDLEIRQLCSDIGINDDAQERVITDLNRKHNIELELMRVRVTEREWALEEQLRRERV